MSTAATTVGELATALAGRTPTPGGGAAAADEWARFMAILQPTCAAARSLPLLALRPGLHPA